MGRSGHYVRDVARPERISTAPRSRPPPRCFASHIFQTMAGWLPCPPLPSLPPLSPLLSGGREGGEREGGDAKTGDRDKGASQPARRDAETGVRGQGPVTPLGTVSCQTGSPGLPVRRCRLD